MLEWISDRSAIGWGSALYALSFLFALATLRKDTKVGHFVFRLTLYAGFLAHTLGLYTRGGAINAFPLTNTFEIIQTLAWAAMALNLILRQLFNLRLLQFFTSGLVAALSGIAMWVPGWDSPPQVTALSGNPWVGFHAGLAIFSYSVFGLLAITSVMYLLQNYGLHSMRSGGLFARLPAIRQLEDINGKLIVLGVSVLTIAIVIGMLNWLTEPGTIGLLKLFVAIGVWLSYCTLLYLRKKNQLVATRFAQACVGLFIVALLSLWPLTRNNGSQSISPNSVFRTHVK